MFVYQRKAGTTDVSVVLRIIDSTDGTPETGVVFNTSGIDLQYRREGAASTAITEATLAALTTAHTDGGFLHIGNGYYRLDLPDAACASGATGVLVHGTVTGMVVIGCYIELVAYDPFDTVRLGLTALPNAAAEAAGGLFTRGTGAGQINQDANGRIDSNVAAISNDSAAADNGEAFFDGTGYTNANNSIGTVSGAVGSVTGNVGGNVVGSVGSVGTNGITAATLAADAGTEIAAAVLGAAIEGSVTLEQSIRLANGVLGGKASGLGTTTATYRNLADSADRVVATVDADGNRSAVTRTLT